MIYENKPEAEKQLFKDAITEYMKVCNPNPTGIEIGVLNGDTSKFLLSLDEQIFLYMIDPFIPDSMAPNLIGSAEKALENTEEFKQRRVLLKHYSSDIVNNFEPEMADFIFIDGSHHYEDVSRDWYDYLPKIKENGLIFIHDSRMYRDGAPFHPGPSKLVQELEAQGNEVVHEAFSLTMFIK